MSLSASGTGDPQAYASAALDAECTILASTAHGRNNQTNRSGFACGQFIPAGLLDRSEVEHRLLSAAESSGIVRKDGRAAVLASLRSGINAGIKEPRSIPSGSFAPRDNIRILHPRPQPKLSDVPVPNWTEPDEEGKPKFIAIGKAEPRPFDDEVRRHVYRRDGEAVRVKTKYREGRFSSWYRVRRPSDGAVGWQARQPAGWVDVPYVPLDAPTPFDPTRRGEVVTWPEGEKDADTLAARRWLTFTFGGTSDCPDLTGLLDGHHVLILADNDQPGDDAIPKKIAAAIQAGAVTIRVCRFPELPEGGDVTDYYAAGGDDEGLLDRAEKIDPLTWRASPGDGAAQADDGFDPQAAKEEPKAKREPSVLFYGDRTPEPPPWLIREILPQIQVAILAGQHSAGKTFIGIDISVSTMAGLPFIGHEVERKGAVLWLAAEGASEVTIRLKAAAVHRLGREAIGELPFAYQAADVPTLSDTDALPKLMRLVDDTKAGLAERFPGVDLALIVVDTLNSAAGFQDENSASEAQKIFNVLRRLSSAAGALVLVVDHYGKVSETGVRGSSAKAGAADAILAALADKDEVTGKITNRRLAVTKLRGAATGKVVPFTLKPVPVDAWGNTHCGVEWAKTISGETGSGQKPQKPAWRGKAKVLKNAIECAIIAHGQAKRPFGNEGFEVKAIERERVRAEFYASYTAEHAEAKRKAFDRTMDQALGAKLIASRELNGVDWMWLVIEEAIQ